jgi:[ribosomal protein S5]-alanine N-acetyltransferase
MGRGRVLLTAATAGDEAEFIAAMRASRALHRPWIAMPETPAAYADYVQRNESERYDRLLLRRRSDDALAGFFNLSEIVRGSFHNAFLGYGGVAGMAGQGYMGEGMQLLLRHAFTTLGLHRVEANIQPGNHASIALAERSGFELEGYSVRYLKVGGRWRDHERWAIRKESWRTAQPARRAVTR